MISLSSKHGIIASSGDTPIIFANVNVVINFNLREV